MNLEKVRPTVGETVGGGRMGANVSGAYTPDYTPLSPDRQNLLTFAQRLHGWGANVTAILPGSKRPAHKWQHWQAARQTVGEVAGLPWRSAVAVGVIDGVGGWRDFDFDDCPTFDPVALVLAELGLPAAYPWVIRTGGGWRVSVLCLDDLPAAILTAKTGAGGGPGVFTFAPKRAGDFDHLELRWRDCQTILAGQHPTAERGYTFAHGSPMSPPAAVPLGRVLRAALAVGELPKHETKPTAAPSTRQVAPSAAKPAEPGQLAAYSAAALSRELDALAHAREGARNVALNRAAFALGQLVGAGLLDRFDVETRLETVALALDLEAGEVQATIKSGLDAGEAQPRNVPDLAARAERPGATPRLEIPAIWRVKHADTDKCPHCGRLWHGATKKGKTTTKRLTCGNRHKCKGALKQLAFSQWGRLFAWESCNVAFVDKGKEYRKWKDTYGAACDDYTGLAVGDTDTMIVVTNGGYGQPTPTGEAVEMLTEAFAKLPKRARIRNKAGKGPRARAKDEPMSPELRALCWTLPETDTDLLAEAYAEADIPFERKGDYIGSLAPLDPDQVKALTFAIATKAATRGSRWRPRDRRKSSIGTVLLSKCYVPTAGEWGEDLPRTEGEAVEYALRERVDLQPDHPLRR